MPSMLNTYTRLAIFSVAMGYMEAAIVVYLRELYYPEGFKFPLVIIPHTIAVTEIFREAATLIMLYGIALLTASTASQRLARFIYCFAIWDIFYYVFLKVLIDWPESLFTWDILFLIPVPWVGPVIAPCILSVMMVALAMVVEYFHNKGLRTALLPYEWLMFIWGSITVIFSFVWDYIQHAQSTAAFAGSGNEAQPLFHDFATYIPGHFNWPVFLIGVLLIAAALTVYLGRLRNMLLNKQGR